MSNGNLIVEHLRAIRAKQDQHSDFLGEIKVLGEIKQRLGFLEEQYASPSRRVDRLDERVERIERRLDLQDA